MNEKIYCKSGGCSAKLGAKKLSHILEKIDSFKDENVLYMSTNDILIRKYHKGLSEGDLIAFENIGAYSVTEGINLFLSRTLPCILLRKKKYDYEVQRGHVESYVLNIPGGRKNG